MIDMNPNNLPEQENEVTINGEEVNPIEFERKENIALGVLGAFLFSLIGALVYFGIYQLGFIAGIAGVVAILLSNLGYGLFSGVKDTMRGIIFAIIFSIIAIIIGEYLCLSVAFYSVWGEAGVSFIDCILYTPQLVFSNSELLIEVIKELGIGLVLCVVASGSLVSRKIKQAKNNK